MPMATETLLDPKTAPMTVGITAKKPPLATPLIITKAIRGPKEFEIGHMTSIEMAETTSDTNSYPQSVKDM